MRLIDADALLIEHCDGCDAFDKGLCDHDVCGAAQLIQEAPTIDAVEVVRCKDCKHMYLRKGWRWCDAWGEINGMGDDGFCNYGERRGDGGW